MCTIIYVAPRIDAKELLEVRALFIEKYGKPFASEAMENKGHCVNEKVIHKVRAVGMEGRENRCRVLLLTCRSCRSSRRTRALWWST